MNEPVVPGGKRAAKDWLGPPFGDKHFVQVITLDQGKRARPEIARAWIDQLVTAIRRHDRQGMITVGLVDWSLDRPGLTSGFVPDKVSERLDFLAVHVYPAQGKVDEALETLAEFARMGKPVLIEETFPLRCSIAEFDEFVKRSGEHAAGWIGFYWGRTREESLEKGTLTDAIIADWLKYFANHRPRSDSD
jgi:hypothetical protein